MANNDSARAGLPQSSQMSTFSFEPISYQQPKDSQPKNYVFVDEHNRHKRLKVMRACQGCRRRKIRCDAATTNSWPCSACIRLKLQCIKPAGHEISDDQGSDDLPTPQTTQPQQPQQPQQRTKTPPSQPPPAPPQQQQHQLRHHLSSQSMYSTATSMDFPQHQLDPSALADVQNQQQQRQQQQQGLYAAQQIKYGGAAGNGMYGQVQQFTDQSPTNLNYTTVNASMLGLDAQFSAQPDQFSPPSLPQSSHSHSSPSDSAYVTNDDNSYVNSDLADYLGTLRMNDAGSAPYLNNRNLIRTAEKEAVVGDDDDEYKSALPPLIMRPGLKIRIPPELMPDDDTILEYFQLYFTHVHPFVPVLDRNMFYEQWRSNREAISPLLIEALLAIGGRLADDPAQGQQWLALATRHADSFMDVPRLSTLQALLVMLKAREAAPKRGYYYRSWMAIVQCVQMGKDLGLNEHYDDHKAGIPCGSASPAECLMKTRIWQTIFVCEVMIGSPQGRTDLSVSVDTVDVREPQPTPGVHEDDMAVSRNFVFFAQIVCNVSTINRIYGRIKRQKDWAADPEFTRMNPLLHSWPSKLPADLTVTFPNDGSPPWIPSAFIGNMHSYYYLSILLLHRPQVQVLDPSSPDGQWKQHMMVCYSSAKLLCRLEEAILDTYGLGGLQNMQRGVNFTIYAVLTSILVHLVALTSPDPDFNTDAREYFTRHMRVLERCMNAWPMADMQKQIDSMRTAFSADTRKPFTLKPSFPYGSPSPSAGHPSPPHRHVGGSAGSTPTATTLMPDTMRSQSVDQIMQQHQQHQQQRYQQQQQQQQQQQNLNAALSQAHPGTAYMGNPISPTGSGAPSGMKLEQPLANASLGLMSSVPQPQETHGLSNMSVGQGWNPSRIFDQWNSTFGTPLTSQPRAATSQTSSLSAPSSSDAAEVPTLQDIQIVNNHLATMNPIALSAGGFPTVSVPAPTPTFITPAMWQESVASVYEGGMKRRWGDYQG